MPKPVPSKNKKRLQLAMLPLLVGSLLWVVLGNQQSDSSSENWDQNAVAVNSANGTDSSSASAKQVKRNWPEFELENLLKHNPFVRTDESLALSDRVGGRDAEDVVQGPAKIKVDVYLASEKGAIALIDGKVVHEGDQLEDGRIITKLTPEFAWLGDAS